MADIVNSRVNEAQAELKKRADRLERLVARNKTKKVPMAFAEGVKLVSDMITGQAMLIDKVVFEAPKSNLEQMRNLQLMTGNMNQSVKDGIKASTDAIDAMLSSLEEMTR